MKVQYKATITRYISIIKVDKESQGSEKSVQRIVFVREVKVFWLTHTGL